MPELVRVVLAEKGKLWSRSDRGGTQFVNFWVLKYIGFVGLFFFW